MKKMLKRSISIILALSLCLVAMQITTLADTLTKADSQTLSEWIEMAYDLSQGKEYASGKDAFDQAYNDAVALSKSGVASTSQIEECIENLKTAWAGLKFQTVTEIAPDGGIANNTGYANFGSSYNTASGKQPKIYYNINATGADFRSDIEMVYLYAYGYQTASVTEDLIPGTTLPIGGKKADTNGVRLCTTDYVYNAFASSTEGYVNRGSIKKIEFSKAQFSNFINLGKLSQIMFCYQNDNNPDATLCAGSLFIVRSAFEQVPVSYELYKWVNRAENLLSQGKTYTSGLDEFNAAIDAAKNATAADDVDTLIANIKTAWQVLKYEVKYNLGYPTVEGGNDTTATYEKESDDLGDKYVRVDSKDSAIKVRFDYPSIDYVGVDWFDDVNEVYFYIKGYQTNATTSDPDSNWTTLNINSDIYYGTGPNVSTTLNKATVDVDSFKSQLTGNNCNFQSLLLQQGKYYKASTWIVGTLYATKSVMAELPSERLFMWIDRAEKVLDMEVEFSDSLDEFNAAVEAMYNADSTSNDDALIADLKAAWNNLTYFDGTKTYKLSLADYGDVNGDGNVDVRDIVRSKKYLAGITNEISDYSLDMNDDGRNAVDDLVAIRNKILNG